MIGGTTVDLAALPIRTDSGGAHHVPDLGADSARIRAEFTPNATSTGQT
jgi:hypothetical protein